MAVQNWRPVYRRLSSRHGKFSADLCLFWHGILEGRQQPINFYSRPARAALESEVQEAVWRYLHQSDEVEAASTAAQNAGRTAAEKADRLTRLWELMQTFIVAQNEAVEFGLYSGPKAMRLPDSTLTDFLHLLYGGENADNYWRGFIRRHHLPSNHPRLSSTSPSIFWDYFAEFQPRRPDIGPWLAANARGRILDLGAGAHSYILVDAAADISRKSLAENKNAKKKIKIRPLDELTSSTWPFRRHSFDTIMLNSILSYTKNHARLFELCHATLGPEGILLITNAPILPHHPAAFFVEKEVTAKTHAYALKLAGFEFENQSTRSILLLKATPRSTRRHTPA